MLKKIKDLIPIPARRLLGRAKVAARIKARETIEFATRQLGYLETHLTDHCNLNCKGCGHYSPLVNRWFADISVFERDMQRLAELFRNIHIIRLMGGEPLLHAEATRFFVLTRRCFPRAEIRIVTNGLLLHKMKKTFWETCSRQNVVVEITVYPITLHLEKINTLAENHAVRVIRHEAMIFHRHMNLRGDSSPAAAMRICRKHYYCPFLRDGKIYTCARPALVHYFNAQFATSLPETNYLDIHSNNLSGRDVLRFLNRPSESCCFCCYDYPEFEWGLSKKNINEWKVLE